MTDNSPPPEENHTPVPTRTIVRWLVRETLGVILVGVVLFLAAGTTDWPMGWALVGVYLVWICANAMVLIPRNPQLIAERIGHRKGAKTWDAAIMSVVGIATLGRLVVAGLDMRYGWTGEITFSIQVIALVVAVLGYAFGVWALAVNAFFSQIVRIQEERGHAVVTDGPYRFVRHPGYVGIILFELAVPVMLGSLWALSAGGLVVVLIVVRTALEDRTLKGELDGYPEYARQVRYRLVPLVW
ncbi:MAG: isoprenylcysteine carboxylmethyltransferase family protein [Fidelibacterota bacterium]|nr:MAG: isoprenylcysteine carboxylmethyltransferase family protein [Candidatus Neomarinimicrobiota bacterium]